MPPQKRLVAANGNAILKAEELTKPHLITLVVALLGGDVEYIAVEDVAIKVDGIAPGRFNWRKYPDRIDLVSVSVALRDAKKPQNGGLLTGNNSKGWMLTPDGLKWVQQLDLSAFEQENGEQQTRRMAAAAARETERYRLMGTKAYALYTSGRDEEITLQDFYQFARMNEYFQSKERARRVSIVDNAVVEDEALSALWTLLKTRFREELETT
jgi:hypothetical protein